MPDQPSTPANQVLTPETIQAGLASCLGGLASLYLAGQAAIAAGFIVPVLCFIIVRLAGRWFKRHDADTAADESTRQLKRVLAETEEKLRVMDVNAPERKQLQKHAAGIREAIYQIITQGADILPSGPKP